MLEVISDAVHSVDELQLAGLDLLVIAHGYERRSSALLRRSKDLPSTALAVQFMNGHIQSFNSNLEALQQAGCTVAPALDTEVEGVMLGALKSIQPGRMQRIGVDISSFSRVRIASIVNALALHSASTPCEVTFFYSIADFTPRPTTLSPNLTFGPVHSRFAGWFETADAPPVAVVGLGYEQDRALGALEHLQVEESRLFVPESPDSRFGPELRAANAVLLDATAAANTYVYSITEPMATYGRLKSLIRGIKLQDNALLLPFGPKMFALLCLLIGLEDSEIAVWRVSPEGTGNETDVIESGTVVSVTVSFGVHNLASAAL